jgi:hypothetical protein
MQTKRASIWIAGLFMAAAPAALLGQFQIAGRKIDFHGFVSQGFAKSDRNNYLTMNTSEGSWAMTDGGLNVSLNLTDQFRVGAQAYSRNIGELSNGKVELDWAFGDYRFTDWLGVRAGKVKTTLGLYNDIQDMEFLHTWALLPQGIYPLDQRSNTIAHTGADLYGEAAVRRAGTFSYVVYGGKRPDDQRGGYYYGLEDAGLKLAPGLRGMAYGADLRWTTPVKGLTAGVSWMNTTLEGAATMSSRYGPPTPITFDSRFDRTFAYYADYQKGKWRLTGEWRRNYAVQDIYMMGRRTMESAYDIRTWYVAGAYRLHRRVEAGGYYSFFAPDPRADLSLPNKKIADTAVTVRVDLTRFWNLKLEEHFTDGYGSLQSTRGFYQRSNPRGFAPTTTMFLMRTGLNF